MGRVWNADLLHLSVPVEDYLRQVNDHDLHRPGFLMRDFFHDSFPMTRIAECPLCRKATSVRIDMLSIKRWRSDKSTNGDFFKLSRFDSGFTTSGRDHTTCAHYFVTDVFIAFGGQLPEKRIEELEVSTEFGPEKPYLMAELTERFRSLSAVMHAVPIGRIRDGRCVPAYTGFLLTYYAGESELSVLQRHIAATKEIPYSYLIYPRGDGLDRNGRPYSEWWDLELQAQNRRLLWLEPETRDFPLTSITEKPFPFTNLAGRDYPIHAHIPPLRGRR